MSDGVEVVEGSQFGGESSGPIFLDQLHCTGDEESLSECDMFTQPGMHMCGHQHDVGVICQRKIMFCSESSKFSTTLSYVNTVSSLNVS